MILPLTLLWRLLQRSNEATITTTKTIVTPPPTRNSTGTVSVKENYILVLGIKIMKKKLM